MRHFDESFESVTTTLRELGARNPETGVPDDSIVPRFLAAGGVITLAELQSPRRVPESAKVRVEGGGRPALGIALIVSGVLRYGSRRHNWFVGFNSAHGNQWCLPTSRSSHVTFRLPDRFSEGMMVSHATYKGIIDDIFRERVCELAQHNLRKTARWPPTFRAACRIMKDGIRHQFPDADEFESVTFFVNVLHWPNGWSSEK